MLNRLERLESPILRHREIELYSAKERRSLLRCGALIDSSPADSVWFHGRNLMVRETTRGWYGVDEDDAFFTPVPLADDDVKQYSVDVPRLVELVRQHNGIEGEGCVEDFGLITVGQRHVDSIGPVDVYLSLANYDTDVFTARCRHLQNPAGAAKVIVLIPRPVVLPATVRTGLDAAGVVLAPLWRAAEGGSLAIVWHSLVAPEAAQDGVLSARKIVYRGQVHVCDLTKKEMDFLAAYLTVDEIDVYQIMHAHAGALWRQRYRPEKGPRQVISKFLSRLNGKLAAAEPPVAISYSLARKRDVITREAMPANNPGNPR